MLVNLLRAYLETHDITKVTAGSTTVLPNMYLLSRWLRASVIIYSYRQTDNSMLVCLWDWDWCLVERMKLSTVIMFTESASVLYEHVFLLWNHIFSIQNEERSVIVSLFGNLFSGTGIGVWSSV